MGVCHCNQRLEGKVAVITGGNAGIGLETAIQLAKKGAQVIIGCRNLKKASQAVDVIVEAAPNARVDALALDLADQGSIKRFADHLSAQVSAIHILVNNAGIFDMTIDGNGKFVKKRTVDGYELNMGTNYVGHFVLTGLLLNLLKAGGGDGGSHCPSRIITLSSFGHIQISR